MEQMLSAINGNESELQMKSQIADQKSERRLQLILLALVSAVLFAHEVLLTRYFSTVMTTNMVYIVVSIAMFGTGIGAFFSYGMLNRLGEGQIQAIIEKYTYLLALSLLIFWGYALIGPYSKGHAVTIIGSLISFVLGGMVMSAIYYRQGKYGHMFYFADLIGTIIACLLVIGGMIFLTFILG